tara:strand:+ start:20488 stop:26571 length:6084 start_codon:yes stop_codon:yes gene_type:complete
MADVVINDEANITVISEESQPNSVTIDEAGTTSVVSVTAEGDNVVVSSETSPALLMITTGGSAYISAVNDGFVGTEVEWLYEVIDSRASVTYVDDMRAQLDDNIAAQNNELRQVIADENYTLSQNISNLRAEYSGVASAIDSVELALSTQEQALTQTETTLRADFNDRISSEVSTINTAISNANEAIASTETQLRADYAADISSAVNTLNTAISNANQSIASTESTLRSEFEGGISGLNTELRAVIATENSVLNQSISNLQSSLTDDITAVNNSLYLAYTDLESSVSQRIDNMETEFNGKYATISSMQTAISNSELSMASQRDLLEARVNDEISSKIDTVNLAIAGETSARTQAITSLQSSLDNQTQANTNLILQTNSNLDGVTEAVAGFRTAVTGGTNSQSEAELRLSSLIGPEGELVSRAYLGTSNTVDGMTTITGINVGGVENGLDFRGNVIRFRAANGVPKLYWDTIDTNRLVIDAKLVLGDGHIINNYDDIKGANAAHYYIRPINGTAIKNNTGTLTVESRKSENGVDELFGDLRVKDSTTLLGSSHTFNAGDITDSLIVEMLVNDEVVDTITLADITDGLDGTDAVIGFIEAERRTWTQAKNNGAWPTDTDNSVVARFYKKGQEIAYHEGVVTLTPGDGNLFFSGGLESGGVNVVVSGEGTKDLTLTFTHVDSGIQIFETFSAVSSGYKGDKGDPGDDGDDGVDGTDGNSVLVVYADDSVGTNQSLIQDNKEYVQYVEYVGTKPTLPVSGNFVKFIGNPGPSGQSIWPIYADDSSGSGQSFSAVNKTWVTFYESISQPTLPVTNQTFVRYVGKDAPTVLLQYSDNGVTWSNTYTTSNKYMRSSTDGGNTWSPAQKFIGENGDNGSYVEFQFAKNTSSTTQPTSGWQDGPPTISDTEFLWMRSRNVDKDGNAGSWSYSRISGVQGPRGYIGAAGAGFYGGTYDTINWTVSVANSRLQALAGRTVVSGDILSQTNTAGTSTESKQYNGSAWVEPALQVNGSIIASGTVASNHLIAGISLTAPSITGGDINIGSGTFVVTNTGQVSIESGSIDINSGNFSVDTSGALTAKSATITGGSLNINNNFVVGTDGSLTAKKGSIDIGSGKFVVSTSGALTATEASIKGAIESGSTITGSTLTGGIVRTATSGYRVELDGNSAYPLWFGTGTKNAANGLLYADNNGGLFAKNIDISGDSVFSGRVIIGGTSLDSVSDIDSAISTNKIKPSLNWKVGTSGSQGLFSQNGSTPENHIRLLEGPFGILEPVWEATGGDNASDGGWNTGSIPIDPNKSYRNAVWMKQVGGTANSLYLGCDQSNTLNLDDTVNTNPYHWSGDLPQRDKWYLVVGIIHGNNYTGGYSGVSGIYDPETGEKVSSIAEFKNDTGSYQKQRVYRYYVTEPSHTAQFVRPRFEEINGEEPSLGTLIGRIPKDGETGPQGPQGPQGVPGTDGVTTYTWIRYADSITGAGISNDPTGKEYIGFAYNKTTASESNNPSDYSWALIKGEQGVQGPQGPDGETLYTWIKYSDVSDGTGLYDLPTTNTQYIGIAVNKDTPVESTNKADYVWSKFKGEQGPQGVPGEPGADGQVYYTWIRYADGPNGESISNDPSGKTYMGLAYNKTSPTESNDPADYSWTRFRGEDGTDGVQGPPGEDGQTTYTWIAYSNNANGSGMYQTPNSNTKYIGIATNKTTASESSNPSDYTWSLFRGEDGAQGPQGPAGVDGSDGANGAGFYGGIYSSISWVTSTADSRLQSLAGRAPVVGDILVQNTSGGASEARQRNANNSWGQVALLINGSMVATGTLAGDRLIAGTELNSPIIKSGRLELVGSNYMSIQTASAFGPNNLLEWKGPRNSFTYDETNQLVNFDALTKANALAYFSEDGDQYFGGSITAGTLKNAIQNSTIGSPVDVVLGPFGSNGGIIEIKSSIAVSALRNIPNGGQPVGIGDPTATLKLYRQTSSGEILVSSHTIQGSYIAYGGTTKYKEEWNLNGSFTFTDSLQTTTDRTYRLEVTHSVPTYNNTQRLSIISEEA